MLTATIDKTKEWTVDDYMQLEEGLLAQLLDGALIMSPAPTPLHQRILRRIYDNLKTVDHKGEFFFSPIDVYLDKKNVLQPDLIFISAENSNVISERGIDGPPDLVVEVVSPSNSYIDRNFKKKKYLEFGVKEVWILDPANRTLEIYADNVDKPALYLASEGQIRSDVIHKLSFNLEAIFSA